MKFLIFSLLLALTTPNAKAESAGGYELKRETEFDFTADRTLLDSSKRVIQYSYVVLNEDRTIHEDMAVRPSTNPAEEALKLDTAGLLAKHQAVPGHEMGDLYIIVSKMAYVVDQDISLFESHANMLNPEFLLAMNPEYSHFDRIAGSENKFRMVAPSILGLSYLPDADLKVSLYSGLPDKPDQVQDEAVRLLLKEDLELGVPAAVIVNQFDHFSRAAGGLAKASEGSFSYMKAYAAGPGRTLLVSSLIVYVYHLVPGGPEAMRKSALNHIPPKVKALEEYQPVR